MEYGKHSYGMQNIRIRGQKGSKADIKIGAFCSIGANVNIYVGGNHRSDWVTTYPFGHINPELWGDPVNGHPATKGDVIIANDVWIGDNVTIMSGVVICDGAIIANNSHVVNHVEPYTVVGGNPAKLIRHRFPTFVIEELLYIQWWNWSDEKIKEFIPLLTQNDIIKFIKGA